MPTLMFEIYDETLTVKEAFIFLNIRFKNYHKYYLSTVSKIKLSSTNTNFLYFNLNLDLII